LGSVFFILSLQQDVVKYAGWQKSQHRDKGKVRIQQSNFSLQGRQNLCGMEDRAQHRVSYQVHVS
jgi:hypothetical protein